MLAPSRLLEDIAMNRHSKSSARPQNPSALRRYSFGLGAAVTLVSALSVGACSGIPRHERDQQALERYTQYAGEPINSFSLLGGVQSWNSVGSNKLLVRTSASHAYLLTVQPPCNDLSFASRIGLTSTGTTVSKGFDSVKVRRERCTITEIRPVDYRQMQQDARQKSEQRKA
jgi:hypothetical protein